MPKPTIRIHDIETNKVIDREMTNEELAVHEAMLESDRLERNQFETKEAEKAALLNRLGLTQEEASLLLK
jgi:hypothetical protein